jgi:hypothetical protein
MPAAFILLSSLAQTARTAARFRCVMMAFTDEFAALISPAISPPLPARRESATIIVAIHITHANYH